MSTTTTSAPYISHQGEARWFGDALFEFLIPNEATGGRLSVFRATLPLGFSPPLHVHTREDEVFHVLDGEATFEIDGRRLSAGPGTSVYMPRGVPHSFVVESPVATMLGVMTPGDFEQLFRTLSTPAEARTLPPDGMALDVARVMAEQRALGTEVVGPPLRLDA
jgi:mannose-6-phosphate isomerase-like protein (cupin superfamily)